MIADEYLTMTEKPVCPYCGEKQEDAWEIMSNLSLESSGDEGKQDCQACNKEFRLILEVEYSYTTEAIPIVEKRPTNGA